MSDFKLDQLRLPATDRGSWISYVLQGLKLPDHPPQLDLFT